MVDLYNAFNPASPLSLNTTFGPDWLKPTNILLARFYRVGAQWNL